MEFGEKFKFEFCKRAINLATFNIWRRFINSPSDKNINKRKKMNADLDYIKLIQLEARIKGKKLVHSNKKESFLRTEEKKRINFLETENGKRKKESFLNVFPTKIISFENFQNNLNVSNCYDDTRAHKPDLFNLKEYSAQDNSNSHHKNEDGNNSLMSWLSDSKTMKNEEENTLKLKIAQIEFQLHVNLLTFKQIFI